MYINFSKLLEQFWIADLRYISVDSNWAREKYVAEKFLWDIYILSNWICYLEGKLPVILFSVNAQGCCFLSKEVFICICH